MIFVTSLAASASAQSPQYGRQAQNSGQGQYASQVQYEAQNFAPSRYASAQYGQGEYGPAQYGPDQYGPSPAQSGPLVDTRCGGVLEASYQYQHGGPAPGLISPATGWYHYGFPVETYRWGWFGAEHYYPTVWWAHGYYGDCCRYGYRCGY
jgi:hypothetical protein